ncbi:CoA transferase [Brevibacterium album]|uniref:CoA transferase n=1 Tax=Brevibacterium album TaxID=417948 RepID=UPI00041559CC|nr:CoA transferase [Brevibacterium album]
MTTPQRWWPGPLDVEGLAVEAVGAARSAVEEVVAARRLRVRVRTSVTGVPGAFAALEHLRVDGRALAAWAPYSGFFPTAEGWVRLHGNYPHHSAVIEWVLGVADREELTRALLRREAQEVEDAVTEAGGIGVRVRRTDEWAAHPHALAVSGDPWVQVEPGQARPLESSADLPLTGIRVLDLTRVIAGPTCSQLLACLGADVLRIDPPQRPELIGQYLSNSLGKRSAVADLARVGHTVRERLLPRTDIVLLGYRPRALARFGLDPATLRETRPHLIVGSLSAWGDRGPWGERAGFDSIVQAASGIATTCADDEGRPGALPVQALDHATGYRLAAGVLTLLAQGRGGLVRASLLGAARTLLARPGAAGADRPEQVGVPAPETVTVDSPHGRLEAIPPPIRLDGESLTGAIGGYGAASLAWAR